MMRRIAMDIRIQFRSGFYLVYFLVALFFTILIALLPEQWRQTALNTMIFADPSFLGFFFIGGLVLLEKDQGVFGPVFTGVRGFWGYWFGKAGSLLVLAAYGISLLLVGGLILGVWSLGDLSVLSARGWGNLAWAVGGILLSVPLYMSLGMVCAALFPRLSSYFLGAGVLLTPLALPLIEVFGVNLGLFGWLIPTKPGFLMVMAPTLSGSLASMVGPAGINPLVISLGTLMLWNIAAFSLAKNLFTRVLVLGQPLRVRGTAKKRPSKGMPTSALSPLAADLRGILRDPLLLALLPAPIFAAVVMQVLPGLAQLGLNAAGLAFSLEPYRVHLQLFGLLCGGPLYGMLAGLMVLDDKDAGVLPFMETLPRPKDWYLSIRIRFFSLVYVVLSLLLWAVGLFEAIDFPVLLLVLPGFTLQIPITLLLMGKIAKNKIQGLAVSKLLGFLLLPPLFMALPVDLTSISLLLPSGWGTLAVLSWQAGDGLLQAGGFAFGGVLYGLILWYVLSRGWDDLSRFIHNRRQPAVG